MESAQSVQCKRADRRTTVDVLDRATDPAIEIDAGDELLVDCVDGYGGLVKSTSDNAGNLDWDTINPCTGPIAVRGAHPGDVLAVDILSITVGTQGYAVTFPDCGLMAEEPMDTPTTISSVENGYLRLPYCAEIAVPVSPLIGVIGVAPAGEGISTLLSGDHGGNMDLNQVTAGSTVYLPVFVDGALLALGDAKAALGDGELGAQSAEVDIEAHLVVRVIRGQSIPRPMIETSTSVCTCACSTSVIEATRTAMRDMVDYLQRKLGLSRGEAHHLVSLVGNARPGNLVNDTVCMSVVVPKSVFLNGLSLP